MLIITKSVLLIMIGFLVSFLLAIIIIPFLKKKKIDQNLSIYLEKVHSEKKFTPTMGGIIFIVSTTLVLLVLLIFNKINMSINFVIVIITFLGYALIGFIDDYLIIKRKNNNGLSRNQKFLLQLLIAVIFFYLFMWSGNEPLLWIHTFGLKLNIGFMYGFLILFILTASSNAVNITDGLDGLATGLNIIAFITFGILSWNAGWLEGYQEIAMFCFVLSGSLIGFLFFNINPAKIFMGDTGSLALGGVLGGIAIMTRHELLLIVIGIVFVIETLLCSIQIIYYKITKKRLFSITPIHHAFEKKGYKERDIVKVAWVLGLLGSMLAISFGVWL